MPKTHEGRVHGDGQLIRNKDFFELGDFSGEDGLDIDRYRTEFMQLLREAKITYEVPYPIDLDEFYGLLLAVRQKYQIAYSNGCHRPRKATAEFLHERFADRAENDGYASITGPELLKAIKESAVADGSANLLFQMLIQGANPNLRKELLSFEPWEHLDDQEDENLPDAITDSEGKGSYGLANSRQYFDIIKPLIQFIYSASDSEEKGKRYALVLEYFEHYAGDIQTLDELVKSVKTFLHVALPAWEHLAGDSEETSTMQQFENLLQMILFLSRISGAEKFAFNSFVSSMILKM